MKFKRGFTIIEAMVTLGVVAIAAGLAGPAFLETVRNNRILTASNLVLSSLSFARMEAVRLNTPVNVGRRSATANDYSQGWDIYTDTDSATGNTAYDGGPDAGGTDTLLKVYDGFTAGTVQVNVNTAGNQWIAFAANGTLAEGGNTVVFAVCDDRGEAFGRQITISVVGRASMITGSPDAPIADCTP